MCWSQGNSITLVHIAIICTWNVVSINWEVTYSFSHDAGTDKNIGTWIENSTSSKVCLFFILRIFKIECIISFIYFFSIFVLTVYRKVFMLFLWSPKNNLHIYPRVSSKLTHFILTAFRTCRKKLYLKSPTWSCLIKWNKIL